MARSEIPSVAIEPEARDLPWGRPIYGWLAFVFGLGTLLFLYRYLAILAGGGEEMAAKVAVQEYVAAFGGGLMFFPFRRFVRARPPTWRRLPLYAAVILVLSICHTSWNWGVRSSIYLLAGWGTYDYGHMPLRYSMELPIDVLGLIFVIAGVRGWDALEAGRARALRASKLEAQLARAQVHNLRLQLQPHFLFNALNTISSTLHTDPDAADEMIDHLAALLRSSLRTAGTDRVALIDELELLDGYLSIQKARFGDRLDVRVEVESGLEGERVPSLFLQPLVENAIRHGAAESSGEGRIAIRIEREDRVSGPGLGLSVEDDGPGVVPGRDPLASGLGLSTTRERLRLLYGDDHRFEAGNRPGGGFRVSASIPLQAVSP